MTGRKTQRRDHMGGQAGRETGLAFQISPEIDTGMFHQMFADAGPVDHHIDAERAQFAGRTDARPHEQGRRVKRAG